MAHKKAGGSTRNGRDSNPKYLGVKLYGGQAVEAGGRDVELHLAALREDAAHHLHAVARRHGIAEPLRPGRHVGDREEETAQEEQRRDENL